MPASPRPSCPPAPALLVLAIVLATGCANQDQPPPAPTQPEPSTESSGFVAQRSIRHQRDSTGSRQPSPSTPARRHRVHTKGASQPEQPPAPTPSQTSDPVADGFVAAHNLHRARVSPAANPPLPSVRWSKQLAANAQAWADRCEFEHSQASLGENLGARSHMAGPEEIVASWVSEGDDFNYASNRCAAGQVCGHYTQVVWRDSTEIGCGVAQCSGNSPFGGGEWIMWVCNYSPAGNYMGERPY